MIKKTLPPPVIDNNIMAVTAGNFWPGIYLKILSCALFAGVNAIVRYLSGGTSLTIAYPLPIYSIMFFQSLFGLAMFIIILLHTKKLAILYTIKHWNIHSIRVIAAITGVSFWYLSFKYIPLAEVVGISFIAPVLTMLGAIIFLHEQITWQKILAFSLSTLGLFFIIRPDLKIQNSMPTWLILLPISATAMFAIDKIVVRKLFLLGESASCITSLLILCMIICSLMPSFYYGWITPHLSHWPWLILLAILGGGAHFSFSKAYNYAEVTTLIPFTMSKLLFCSLAGYLAFGEYPKNVETWLGIIILLFCSIIFKFK